MDGPYAGGTVSDMSMLAQSKLRERVLENCRFDGTIYHLFGDCGYTNHAAVMVPHPKSNAMTAEEKTFNKKMSKVRVSIEWGFGRSRQLLPFVDYEHELKLNNMPVGTHYFCATLLTNCYNCLYGSTAAKSFRCPAPDLRSYFK